VTAYLKAKDADFAYWPLNVGPKAGHGADAATAAADGAEGGDESYGLLRNDWSPRWPDERLRLLRMCCPPNGSPQRGGRAPSQAQGGGTSGGASSGTSGGASGGGEALVAPPAGWPPRLPLCLAPWPWCAPLPGPLTAFPKDASPGAAACAAASAALHHPLDLDSSSSTSSVGVGGGDGLAALVAGGFAAPPPPGAGLEAEGDGLGHAAAAGLRCLPEPRYHWTLLQGLDADADTAAVEVTESFVLSLFVDVGQVAPLSSFLFLPPDERGLFPGI